MALTIKLSTSLRPFVPDYDPFKGLAVDFQPGWTVRGLLRSLGIPADQVKIIMLNGRASTLETELHDGDRVGFFPPVGGG